MVLGWDDVYTNGADMNSWRDYRKSLNEIEAYQKQVRQGYVKDRNEYLTTGPESPGVAYPNKPPKTRAKSAAPGFGAMGEEVEEEEDDEVLEEDDEAIVIQRENRADQFIYLEEDEDGIFQD